ncbi:DUF1801 domain-containing protein [Corynebacterium sp. YIM 101645]|uniref:DUF1801 domain-containing protein n=1 Tax=Corynebacterium lemuris TaxID=1859292 RepID=A0ABT2FSR9_9CORY|nr:DUF1801 domain-containing protein [Corynebacterium lemuris]MCS5478166.1 DUF1801 domain-containing protein [Corynebacterium lemuris]
MGTSYESLPGVPAPARRALAAAGHPDLESLHGIAWPELLELHGVGRRGLERLQAALLERGLSMADVPGPEGREAGFTLGHTGVNAADIRTHATDQSPAQYVEELDTPRRVEHGRLLLEIFRRATGEEPVMWGPSMIGYGQMHYRYATGREGDTFRVGFSPRKAKLALYGLPQGEGFLSRLGKHTAGSSCIYVNKPEDIDLAVLEEMIRAAWVTGAGEC